MAGEYRKRMNHFVRDLFKQENLGQFLENGIVAKDVEDGKNGRRDVTIEEFAPVGDPNVHRRDTTKDSKVQFSVYAATGKFSETLKTILSRSDAFDIFKKFMCKYNKGASQPLFNEGGNDKQFTREDIEHIMKQQQHAGRHAGGDNGDHGGGGHH